VWAGKYAPLAIKPTAHGLLPFVHQEIPMRVEGGHMIEIFSMMSGKARGGRDAVQAEQHR
jgi:hypothetical protein